MSLESVVRFGDIYHSYFGQTQCSYLITGIDFIDKAAYVLNKYFE